MSREDDRIRQLLATMRAEHAATTQRKWMTQPEMDDFFGFDTAPRVQAPGGSVEECEGNAIWIAHAHERELEVADALEALLAENAELRKMLGAGAADVVRDLVVLAGERGKLLVERDARIERLENACRLAAWAINETHPTLSPVEARAAARITLKAALEEISDGSGAS